MENIEHYTLPLLLRDAEKALKNGWRSKISASHNLGEALQKCIKSNLGPADLKKVNILLSKDDVEDFIDPNISGYVTSLKGTMAYLAALYPSKGVLVNTQLQIPSDIDEKPDLIILSLSKEGGDGYYHSWGEMVGKIRGNHPSFVYAPYRYDGIKKIKHLKVLATAYLNPDRYVFKRDLPEWGHNFAFTQALLRLCNLQDMHFAVVEMPGAALQWSPVIASGCRSGSAAFLLGETFEIRKPEKVRFKGCPDLLCMEKRFALKSQGFTKKEGTYRAVVPITHMEETIGLLDLSFMDAEA